MRRYYFTLTDSEIIVAETEAEARAELERWTDRGNSYVLESVEDA